MLLQNSFELRIVAGVIIILFSLHIIGVINLKFLNYEKRIQTNNNKNIFSPIIIGAAFGFGWTPCIGPILGSILVLDAQKKVFNPSLIQSVKKLLPARSTIKSVGVVIKQTLLL